MARKCVTKADRKRAERLGALLKEARERRGLTQAGLALRSETHLDWVRQLEQGRIADPSAFKLAAVLSALGERRQGIMKEAMQ